jgi:outer membrane murein-binding lipoprotein Lpp
MEMDRMRIMLTWMSALMLCGCLGRAKPDLLQARLREQQEYVVDVERRMEAAQSDLQQARREAEQLRAEIARSGKRVVAAEYTESLVRASKLQINSLMTGGLNRDDKPGDDALVAYLCLVDDDGEAIKLPGTVQLTLLDPSLPEPSRQIGYWQFTAEECRSKWTRGFTGAGYQFTVPLDQPSRSEQLVLNAKLTTADDRVFDATQLVRVGTGSEAVESRGRVPVPADEPGPLDDINDPPPAPVDSTAGSATLNGPASDWEDPVSGTGQTPNGAILDSTNWTRDAIPQRR